jgi:hypothetical protein
MEIEMIVAEMIFDLLGTFLAIVAVAAVIVYILEEK